LELRAQGLSPGKINNFDLPQQSKRVRSPIHGRFAAQKLCPWKVDCFLNKAKTL
jgi:hypothetical protein